MLTSRNTWRRWRTVSTRRGEKICSRSAFGGKNSKCSSFEWSLICQVLPTAQGYISRWRSREDARVLMYKSITSTSATFSSLVRQISTFHMLLIYLVELNNPELLKLFPCQATIFAGSLAKNVMADVPRCSKSFFCQSSSSLERNKFHSGLMYFAQMNPHTWPGF